MADGFTAGRAGAPALENARVDALRTELESGHDPTAFGREPADALARALERVAAEMRHRDFAEGRDLLRALDQPLCGLDPAALEPRRGLAGLFDGRGPRLKRFRARFAQAAATLDHVAEELADRSARLSRRVEALETLQDQVRTLVLDLDAHVAAALAARPAAPRAAGLAGAVADLTRAVEAEADPASIPPWIERARHLRAASDSAARGLAVIRMAQNACAAGPLGLGSARETLERWRSAWREGLGLDGRRRRIRPDAPALARDLQALRAALEDADQALERARLRHAEAERRLTSLR